MGARRCEFLRHLAQQVQIIGTSAIIKYRDRLVMVAGRSALLIVNDSCRISAVTRHSLIEESRYG